MRQRCTRRIRKVAEQLNTETYHHYERRRHNA